MRQTENAMTQQASPKKQQTDVSLEEIAEMARTVLPPLPAVPSGGEALGKYADVWRWLAASQFEQKPSIRHPRIALFTTPHGAYPEKQTVMANAVAALHAGEHALSPVAQEANADLQVYDLSIDQKPRDFRKENALLPHEAGHAASYGLMAVQPGLDLLVAACLNPAAEKAGEAILFKLKNNIVPFEALLQAGGLDIAALLGSLIAARLAHVPVLLDGKGAEAAGALLEGLNPGAAAHTRNASQILDDRLHPQPGMAGALLITFLKSLAKVS